MRAFVFASLLAAGCVRAPSPIDVSALIAKRGPEEARRDLAIRVLDSPRDVQARLALAALAEQVGRPTEAIEQLEAVERLGGPLGVRWHDADRVRLARLLLARGRARLVRGAPTALGDLERAAKLGAKPSDDDLVSARIALASTLIRHVDDKMRAKGRAMFASLAKPSAAKGDGTEEASWLGARAGATPAERGAFGAWLWTINARREAWEHLRAWHDATPRSPSAVRDEALQAAYLRAYAWWVPVWLGEAPPPPSDDLVGPERCQFPGSDCAPAPADVLPLPPLTDDAATLRRVPQHAAARYAATRSTALPADAAMLATIAEAYDRDPMVAERLGRDFVARAVDGALGHATLGALFDALGDRARARIEWQAAVDGSDEPAFVRGLAEAVGRAGDGPAALVFATSASAAWGDPAVVWNSVAAALLVSTQYVEALTAVRTALDLAGPEELARTLELGIVASRALKRDAQADALGVKRTEVILARTHGANAAEAEAVEALAAHGARPTAVTTARLWVAARTNPRNLEIRIALVESLDRDDVRRQAIMRDLLELTGDESSVRALAAVAALRAKRDE